MISLPAGSCACACVSSVLRKCQCVSVREVQPMGTKSDGQPATTALCASICSRDEGVRSIYQLAHVFVCRVRSLRLLSGHRPSCVCVCVCMTGTMRACAKTQQSQTG